eukprot:4121225-Prymnesium_polylepis.1
MGGRRLQSGGGATGAQSLTALATKCGKIKMRDMVDGEAPAAVVSPGIEITVQKGLHTAETDRTIKPEAIQHPGAQLPVYVYKLGDPETLEVIITDFQKIPYSEPQGESGKAKPRLASYTKAVEAYHRGALLAPHMIETLGEHIQTVGRRMQTQVQVVNATALANRFIMYAPRTTGLCKASNSLELTRLAYAWQARATLSPREFAPLIAADLSGCIRDSQCSGPDNYDPPVDGKCIDAR